MVDENPPPRHLAIRYSDQNAPEPGTVELHKAIIERVGYVWLGKFGKPIAARTLAMLNGQVAGGIETTVFLISSLGQRGRGVYSVAACRLVKAAQEIPVRELSRVPAYYGPGMGIGAWLNIDRIDVKPSRILDDYVVASSLRPLGDALARSMAGAFIVLKESDRIF